MLVVSAVLLVISAVLIALGQRSLEVRYQEQRNALRQRHAQVLELLLQRSRARLDLIAYVAFGGRSDTAVAADDLRVLPLDGPNDLSEPLARLLGMDIRFGGYGIACDPACVLWRLPRSSAGEPAIAVGLPVGPILMELLAEKGQVSSAVAVQTDTLHWPPKARTGDMPEDVMGEVENRLASPVDGLDIPLHLEVDGVGYEISIFSPALVQGARIVLVQDTNSVRGAITRVMEQRLLGTVAALTLLAVALLIALRGPLRRLRRTTENALPLLAGNRFEEAREAIGIARRGARFSDEIDHLDDTAMDLSLRLEGLQADVAERTKALQQERDFVSRLLDTPQVLILTQDQTGRILLVNQYALRLTGYDRQKFAGQRFFDLMLGGEEAAADIERLLEGRGRMVSHESVVACANGQHREVVWFHSRLDPRGSEETDLAEPAGRPALVSAGIDITERKQAERRLFDEKERAQVTLQSIRDGVVTINAEGKVDYVNPTAERMGGVAAEESVGRPFTEVFRLTTEDGSDRTGALLEACLEHGGEPRVTTDLVLSSAGGDRYAVAATTGVMRGRGGGVGGAVFVLRDVSQERHMARKLSYQASHDALTGLINRREFEARIDQALDDAKAEGSEHVLLFLDLDRFKTVNDSCGHRAGDELLKQLAHLLQKTVRAGDSVARLGGDEFGILLTHCHLDRATPIAETARRTVHEHRFAWDGKVFTVGASVGLVSVNAESKNLEELLNAADSACYAAKESGRNRVTVHGADDIATDQNRGEARWLSRIQGALEEDRFRLFAQPIMPLRDSLDGPNCEVLLRMVGEDGALMPPGAFIPPAERYNLMVRIDRWVLRAVVDALSTATGGDDHRSLTLNLSGHSLGEPEFQEFVRSELTTSDLDPRRLAFEITETAAIANLTGALEFMKSLRELGCRFVLDDFGSGLSSFGYLKTLPVEYLKIDGMFVRDIGHDPVGMAMVRSIGEIGQVMGIQTIAECAETQDVLDLLKTLPVDFVQGFAVGVPKPLADVLESTDLGSRSPQGALEAGSQT